MTQETISLNEGAHRTIETNILNYLHEHKLSKQQEKVKISYPQEGTPLYACLVRTWIEKRTLEIKSAPDNGPEKKGNLQLDVNSFEITRPNDWETVSKVISFDTRKQVEKCSVCKGEIIRCDNQLCHEGKITCRTCSGMKNILCLRCNGTILINCDWCGGDFQKKCFACDYGHDSFTGTSCTACGGKGFEFCSNCQVGKLPCGCNSGRVCCPDCDARGEVCCDNCDGFSYLRCTTCLGLGMISLTPIMTVEYTVETNQKFVNYGYFDQTWSDHLSWDLLKKATAFDHQETFASTTEAGLLDSSAVASVLTPERKEVSDWVFGAIEKYRNAKVLKQHVAVGKYPVFAMSLSVVHLFRKEENHTLYTIGRNYQVYNATPPSPGRCTVM